ncbi:MAG TPA: type II toxin-antitoxin system VapC family toxin [Streptosporangiaceae bacterium]|nr:type II toxin-antitoxin system VapC family toxin [Streptosporangiaceae bacterium]
MTYLLDTNVVFEIRKRQPDPNVLAWWATISSAQIFVSVLTVGEIRLGIERLRRHDRAQAELLERWLHGLLAAYTGHIVGIDASIAEEWARLNVPDPMPIVDGLLAATARVRGWVLVTRNTSDLDRTGVPLLNPFQPQARNR